MDITADDYYSFDFSLKVRLSSVTFVQHNENTVSSLPATQGKEDELITT